MFSNIDTRGRFYGSISPSFCSVSILLHPLRLQKLHSNICPRCLAPLSQLAFGAFFPQRRLSCVPCVDYLLRAVSALLKGITVAQTSIKAEASSRPGQQDDMESLGQMKWKTNQPSLKYARVSELWQILSCRQSAFPWRNVSWFATQGKDLMPSPHYDHQTLIFPSSLPRGLALLMEILHFLEEIVFRALLFLLGLILMQQIDRKQRCRGQDQRLFLFISWQV